MKNTFSFALALVLVLGMAFMTATPVAADTINVPGDYDTIQEAVNAANPGDTIIVAAGTYNESIVVNKSLTLLGAQADVDPRPSVGGRPGPESIIVSSTTALSIGVGGDNVVVNGFTFESHINSSSPNVVEAVDAKYPQILYNIVYNTNPGGASNEGIKVRKSGDSGAVVSYNYVYDIPKPGDAINFDRVNGGIISYNEVRNIGSENAAVYIYNSLGTTIEGNLVDTTTQNDGIKLGNKGGQDAAKIGGSIINNTVRDTVQDGITIYMSDVLVAGNDVSGSTSENGAIYLAFGISNIIIQSNCVRYNSLRTHKHVDAAGILLESRVNAATVTVNNNSIKGNTPYGVTNKAADTLDAKGNWWGDASGPYHETLNPTGTGDSVSDRVLFVPWLTGLAYTGETSFAGGDDVVLQATVSSSENGAEGVTVDFYLDGDYVGSAATDNNGVAEFNTGPQDAGSYDVTVKAAGCMQDTVKIEIVTGMIEATVSIHPQTLNLRTQGRWITAYIQLPQGYAAEDIDIDTVQLVYEGQAVDADWGTVQNGVLMVKFDRADVAAILEVGDSVEVSVVGKVNDTPFEGTTTIRVIDPMPPGRGRP